MDILPSSSSNPSSLHRNPNHNLESPTDPSLRPANSAAFKRETRRKRRERKRQEKLQLLLDDWNPLADQRPSTVTTSTATASVSEWPSETVADRNYEIGWNLSPRTQSTVRPWPPASAEVLAQQNALRSCREHLFEDDSSDEEERADGECNGGKSYNFLKDLFDKERDLREYYRKNWAKGEFDCLVCGGIGEKLGKRFMGLAGLVQHANFISKTKRKMAHRAYGRVVCDLLSWEFKSADIDHNEDGAYFEEEAMEDSAYNQEVVAALKGAGEDVGEGVWSFRSWRSRRGRCRRLVRFLYDLLSRWVLLCFLQGRLNFLSQLLQALLGHHRGDAKVLRKGLG